MSDEEETKKKTEKNIELMAKFDVFSASLAWLERHAKELKEAQFRAKSHEAKMYGRQLKVLENRVEIERKIRDAFIEEYNKINPPN